MSRILKTELNIDDLYIWNTVDKFVELVNAHLSVIKSRELFRSSKNNVLQEAWVAAKIIKKMEVEFVRMCPDDFPDFEIKLNEIVFKFEITEAYESGRRRETEYRTTGTVTDDPFEEWEPRVDRSIEAMKTAIRKKVDKHYSQKCSLIVYLSTGNSFGKFDYKIREAIPEAVREAKSKFESIYIMWSDQLEHT